MEVVSLILLLRYHPNPVHVHFGFYTLHNYSYIISFCRCPICMNDFIPGETIRLLPCMHYYHIRCIDEWLLRALTCPNCIQRVDLALQRSNSYRHGHSRNGSRGSICSMNNEISNNSNCSSPTGSSEQLHSPVFSSPTPQNVTAEVHFH